MKSDIQCEEEANGEDYLEERFEIGGRLTYMLTYVYTFICSMKLRNWENKSEPLTVLPLSTELSLIYFQ